ncbi:MAG: hypothetical protein ABSG98_03280 [Anaerolineales bacterium]
MKATGIPLILVLALVTSCAPAATIAPTLSVRPSSTPRPTGTPIATRTPAPLTPTMTFPAPNPAYSLLTVGLQAVAVSDDDGEHTAHITAKQVNQWDDQANKIFAKASVRFIYDPHLDFATLKSTVLNDMSGDSDANWLGEVDVANQVAAGYPGRVVVLFTYGPGKGPEGGGFSWSDYNFVKMPGFNIDRACGYQDISLLAHEIGHYFGLSHPFAEIFPSLQAAESYFSAHGNNPEIFDGDGLSDTPPDPFINTPEFECEPVQSVTLNGRVFPLPRTDIMSYYGPPAALTDLTPQQSNIVRLVLELRAKNGMATPTNLGVPGAIDFATLPIEKTVDMSPSVQGMSTFGDVPRWSGDKQLFSNAQPNSVIGFSVSVGGAGKYQLNLYATMAPDYGKIQTLVDGSPLGPAIDLYAPIVLPSGRIPIGTIDLAAGTHALSFRVVGKNAASINYSVGLNAFTLTAGQG